MYEIPNPATTPFNWHSFNEFNRAFSDPEEFMLWQTEYGYFREMARMGQVPGVEYGHKNLGAVVYSFLREIDKQMEAGTLDGKTFILFVEGLPNSGKDFTSDRFIIPAIEAHLKRLRLKNENIPSLDVSSWDDTQARLRKMGMFTSALDEPSEPGELYMTRTKLEEEIRNIIDRKYSPNRRNRKIPKDKGCRVLLVKNLTGTALKTDEDWSSDPEKIYGDMISDFLDNTRFSSHFEGLNRDDLVISRIALESGPWSLIWQHYRWATNHTKTIATADKINKIFHLPPFASQEEYETFKSRGGGNIKTIEKALEKAELANMNLPNIEEILSREISPDLISDIKVVSPLLGTEDKFVRDRLRIYLANGMLHENNIRKSGIPEYLTAVIFNNYRLDLTEGELWSLWNRIIDILVKESEAGIVELDEEFYYF